MLLFPPMQSICDIVVCLLSIVTNIILVVRKPSGIFAAGSIVLVLLVLLSDFIFVL